LQRAAADSHFGTEIRSAEKGVSFSLKQAKLRMIIGLDDVGRRSEDRFSSRPRALVSRSSDLPEQAD
jgi:hypothetical protein